MNHRPFEDWLLDDIPLTAAQRRELDLHLRTCRVCAAIAESNLALRSARVVSPTPGFSERWEKRLVLARKAQRTRGIIGSLVFSLGGLALLLVLAGPTLVSVIGAPEEWIAMVVSGAVFIYSLVVALSEAGSVMLRVMPGIVPPFAWLVMFSSFSGLALLWSVSIWRLTRSPQGA